MKCSYSVVSLPRTTTDSSNIVRRINLRAKEEKDNSWLTSLKRITSFEFGDNFVSSNCKCSKLWPIAAGYKDK